MSAPAPILAKIKLLLKLTASPNANEAENARVMADKLVTKYNITEDELKSLEDKKPLYGEDEKVFMTIGLCGWRQQLVLAIGKHFDCQIVQEEIVPAEGLHAFSYFAYGEPEDVVNIQFVFHVFAQKVEELVQTKCLGRGPIYVSSYCEGVVEAIKNNIYWDGIDIPNIKRDLKKDNSEKIVEPGEGKLTKPKSEKEKPVQESVDVNSQSLVKDVNAYFRGLNDGDRLHLKDALELEAENKRIKEIEQ